MKFTIENEKINGNLGFGEIAISTNGKSGYRSYELFVSSLIGCSGTVLQNILTKKRFLYQKIEMDVTSVRNSYRANRIEKLAFIVHVQSEETLTSQQAEKIANLVVNNCGMIQSVIQSIEISFTIKSVPSYGGHE